jgi:hypothetical protein
MCRFAAMVTLTRDWVGDGLGPRLGSASQAELSSYAVEF